MIINPFFILRENQNRISLLFVICEIANLIILLLITAGISVLYLLFMDKDFNAEMQTIADWKNTFILVWYMFSLFLLPIFHFIEYKATNQK